MIVSNNVGFGLTTYLFFVIKKKKVQNRRKFYLHIHLLEIASLYRMAFYLNSVE